MVVVADHQAEDIEAIDLDEDIEAATREVDRGLIRWMLGLSLRERLQAGSRTARMLGRFRRVQPSPTS